MVQTYRCPGCGAPIRFSPGADELACEFCGTHVRVSELNSETDTYEYQVENEVHHDEADRQSFSGYSCQSCGAHLIVDENTTATNCCYCGSPSIIQERLNGVLKPAGVIPFKQSKNEAKEIFRQWICKGLFTPSLFKRTAALEEIKGIYVPFWLYDYEAQADVEAEGAKVSSERRGNTEYTHTDYYRVLRNAKSNYQRVPADASEKMADDLMDMMEPYNYSEIKPFEMPYLSGFESEKYNYESDDAYMSKRVEDRVSTYIFQDVKETINYSRVRYIRNDVSLRRKRAEYVLLPVWMITYRYQGENRIFAMNGQTGKQIGTLPNSKEKMAGCFAGITLGIAIILRMLGGFFG